MHKDWPSRRRPGRPVPRNIIRITPRWVARAALLVLPAILVATGQQGLARAASKPPDPIRVRLSQVQAWAGDQAKRHDDEAAKAVGTRHASTGYAKGCTQSVDRVVCHASASITGSSAGSGSSRAEASSTAITSSNFSTSKRRSGTAHTAVAETLAAIRVDKRVAVLRSRAGVPGRAGATVPGRAFRRERGTTRGHASAKGRHIVRSAKGRHIVSGGAPGVRGNIAADWALRQLGKPYEWAAAGPDAFDCSGLVMRAWEQAGVGLGHWTGSQWTSGPHVPLDQLRRGDLVFFAYNTGEPATIHHVGIYIGGGMMVDAPTQGEDVRIEPIHESGLIGATRPV
jgi:cell wall-associated NlpC family hydrolase